VKSSFHRTASLSDQEIRELWKFRLSLVNLKPTVSPEQDLAAFTADLRWPGWVWILRDQGQVAGMFLQRAEPIDFGGRRLLAMMPEYGFLAPHLRGHPVLPLASLTLTMLAIGRHQRLPWFVAASTYPPGFIAFRRALRPFWHLRSPDLPPRERELLLHLGRRISGEKFDENGGTVEMRTRPIVTRDPATSSHADARAIHAEYQAANPAWREGRGLFFLFPLGAGQIARVLGHATERLLRRERSSG
jgi:hypothetical protein